MLLPDHSRALTEGSGIDPTIIESRGYRTIENKSELEKLGFGKSQLRVSALLIPLHGVDGSQVGYQSRPDDPRKSRASGKPIKYETPRGMRMALDVHPQAQPLVGDPAVPLFITEGIKKGDSLVSRGACAIALLGVWNWRGTNDKGGKTALADWESVALEGRKVYIAFDSDVMVNSAVHLALKRLAAFLKSRGAIIFFIYLSDGAEGEKVGVDDYLAAGHSIDELKELASPGLKRIEGGKPRIVIRPDERRVADEAIAALSDRDLEVFQRGTTLVTITREFLPAKGIDRPRGAPTIKMIPAAQLRERLSDCATWIAIKEDANTGEEIESVVHPPQWCVNAVAARLAWKRIRPLAGVVEHPVLLPDGSILQTLGYDESSGLFYIPGLKFPPIRQNPTQDDAKRAADEILEIVEDFPFETPEHRAGWLAAYLNALARYAFDGPSPLFAFDANTRGSGKTLLADSISMALTGRSAPRMTAPRDDEEFRKRITASALAGDTLLLLDNATSMLGSASLDAALTGTFWRDRILGKSENTTALPLRMTWLATGNNLVFGRDTLRRVCYIRLNSPEERPEERSGFRHPNLLAWIRRERPRLLAAGLTLLRSYCAAGRPDQGLRPWGSFEGWTGLVRNALVFVGLPDPADTRIELMRVSDRDAGILQALLLGLEQVFPNGQAFSIANLFRQLAENPDDLAELRTLLESFSPSKDGRLNPRSLGMRFHSIRGRVIAGRVLERSGEDSTGVRWCVLRAGSESEADGTSGTDGTVRVDAGARVEENADPYDRPPGGNSSTTSTSSTNGPELAAEMDLVRVEI